MATETTIIYYTDNSLEECFAQKVRDYLTEAAGDMPIVSVSQKPLDFGTNVCLGDIGRSHLSMFRQLLVGAKTATTKHIALAEHDCLYTKEHFEYVPSNGEFCYNINHWFVQWNHRLNGQYSHNPNRKAMSQLICDRNLFIQAVNEKIYLLNAGSQILRGQAGACEPGVANGKSFKNLPLGYEPVQFKHKTFETKNPNLDIRHGKNFSGRRRYKQKAYSLPYWGSFHQVMNKPPEGKWYQNVLPNLPQHSPRAGKSKFYNEGKWKNFIEPLLPYKQGVFVEMGCNAGLYLKMAKQAGFRQAVGIEGDLTYFNQAQYYKGLHGEEVEIKHKTVGGDFKFNDIPLADVTLLSNFHYWLEPDVLRGFIDCLKHKTLYCLVVGRKKHSKKQILNPNLEILREFFRDWTEEKVISDVSSQNDPVPKRMYSVLFKNTTLERYRIEDIKKSHLELWHSTRFVPSYNLFVRQLWSGKEVNIPTCSFYRYGQWRGWEKRMGRKWLIGRVKKWGKLAVDVKKNGIIDPLTINQKGIVTDGDHRLIIADMLNYSYVICKEINDGINSK